MSNETSPVDAAHRSIHQPNADVQKVLSSLTVPSLHDIPSITDPAAKPGQWAKYTAMVQDIWDTEIFVSSSPDGKSGLLVENAAASEHAGSKLAERLPIYLVSLPGETHWARHQELNKSLDRNPSSAQANTSTSAHSGKRARELDTTQDTEMDDSPVESATPQRQNNDLPEPHDKRSRPNSNNQSSNLVDLGLNLPVHGQPGASAIVAKLYDSDKSRQVKINSVVEVVGILQDGLDLHADSDVSDEFAAEFAARNPRNVKRLHVVSWRELSPWEQHPLTCKLGKSGFEAARNELAGVAKGMREIIIKYFASALCGDIVAAEYLLLCLVSKPSRTETTTILGKLAINIVYPNGRGTTEVANILGALRNVMASVVEVPVNIAGLNSLDLYPKKDYTLNRLKAGALQMAPGTCLFGNECALSNGQLAERGVKNVRALSTLAQRCMIPIDFEYYESEVAVDCCSVFVSNGGKSIIPTDATVRVRETGGETELQGWKTYDEDLLRKMRLAICLMRDDGEFEICDEAARAVENIYIEARKVGQAEDGQETLQRWLSTARCCARSFGESSLTAERWMHAVQLERSRGGM